MEEAPMLYDFSWTLHVGFAILRSASDHPFFCRMLTAEGWFQIYGYVFVCVVDCRCENPAFTFKISSMWEKIPRLKTLNRIQSHKWLVFEEWADTQELRSFVKNLLVVKGIANFGDRGSDISFEECAQNRLFLGVLAKTDFPWQQAVHDNSIKAQNKELKMGFTVSTPLPYYYRRVQFDRLTLGRSLQVYWQQRSSWPPQSLILHPLPAVVAE